MRAICRRLTDMRDLIKRDRSHASVMVRDQPEVCI